MEALPQHSINVEAHPERMLPSGHNKVERIGSQTRGLAEDVKSWVELRVKLMQAEIQEKVQSKINESIIKIAPVIAGALAGLFALVTIALFLGWWLGHPAWGYLIVTVVLLLVTGVLLARKNRYEEKQKEKEATSNGSVA